jgi:hypothetical protein
LPVLTCVLPAITLAEDPARTQPGTPAVANSAPIAIRRSVESENLVAGAPYSPITAAQRAEWWAERSLGWQSFAAGIAQSGARTWLRASPEEWGGSWEGFGKRAGTRQAETLLSRGIEAGLGSVWGEDPRYFRSGRSDISGRLRHAVVSAFVAYYGGGNRGPAAARAIGIVSARVISRSWTPPDRPLWQESGISLGTGFAGRAVSNLFREFLPDLTRKPLRKKQK